MGSCSETAEIVKLWLWMGVIVGGILNFCSVLALLLGINLVRKLPQSGNRLSDLCINLCQTGIRGGIGSSARRALIESARMDPKLVRLIREEKENEK